MEENVTIIDQWAFQFSHNRSNSTENCQGNPSQMAARLQIGSKTFDWFRLQPISFQLSIFKISQAQLNQNPNLDRKSFSNLKGNPSQNCKKTSDWLRFQPISLQHLILQNFSSSGESKSEILNPNLNLKSFSNRNENIELVEIAANQLAQTQQCKNENSKIFFQNIQMRKQKNTKHLIGGDWSQSAAAPSQFC